MPCYDGFIGAGYDPCLVNGALHPHTGEPPLRIHDGGHTPHVWSGMPICQLEMERHRLDARVVG